MSSYIIICPYILVYNIISQYMSAYIIICHYIPEYMSSYIIMCHYISVYASLCQKMTVHSRNLKLEGTSTAVWLQASASISYLAVYCCCYPSTVHAESYSIKDFSNQNFCVTKCGRLLDSCRTCGPA
jgi:hypothetical protein